MRKSMIAAALMTAVAAPGCGGGSDGDDDAPGTPKASKPGTVLKIRDTSTPGKWSFDKKRLTAQAGRVAVEFTNPSDLGHNVRIQTGSKCCFEPGHEDLGGTEVIGGLRDDAGKTARATLDLEPGRYWFLCANPGHWQAGQRGRLVVN